jgi:hypothetical protein
MRPQGHSAEPHLHLPPFNFHRPHSNPDLGTIKSIHHIRVGLEQAWQVYIWCVEDLELIRSYFREARINPAMAAFEV